MVPSAKLEAHSSNPRAKMATYGEHKPKKQKYIYIYDAFGDALAGSPHVYVF